MSINISHKKFNKKSFLLDLQCFILSQILVYLLVKYLTKV